jgi:outer membrane protein assembly factor BamB
LCIYATPAYYNGTIYIGLGYGTLIAMPLANGLISSTGGVVTPSSQSAESYQYPGPTATISASPSGNAVVWVLDNSANGTLSSGALQPAGPAILRAYDATNLGHTLYSSSAVNADQGGKAVKFTVPVIANGHVYVAGSGQLTVYGLAP